MNGDVGGRSASLCHDVLQYGWGSQLALRRAHLMNLKSLALAGLAAAGLALSIGAADAKTRLHIGVGVGDDCAYYGNCYYDNGGDGVGYGYYGGGTDDGYDYRRRHRSSYDYDEDYGGLSCWQARRIVRNQGFRRVQAQDCSGRRYTFTGWSQGEPFRIKVSAQSGRIISVRPLGY
jgi:hypothetical protein